MNLGLTGYEVVIVGGTKGIGFSIALGFLSEGANVHIISRNYNVEAVDQLTRLYKSNVFFYQADATNLVSLEKISEKILHQSKNKIDVLVSNVGSGSGVKDAIPSEIDWVAAWDLNFISALNSVRVFSKFISEKYGSITFISSIAGQEFIGAPISYSTAKSALISFSKTLSHKLAPNIRVNTISPGNIFFEGGAWEKKLLHDPEFVAKLLNDKVPLKKFGTPEDVSNMVIFISSKMASFITGSCIVIDGGQTISY